MLDVGGGGGGTPWESMTMDTMQQLIQNPNVEKHWELLTGWRRSADLVNQHRSQVQSYRDNLAAAWPPEKSPAAAAYLTRLDDLIANLTETYEAAVANHTAFSTATVALSLAQKDMDEIYREYAENGKLLAAYTLQKQEREGGGTPQPSPSPSGGDMPPVAPGRQQELERRAVALLSGVSGDLAQAQVRIVKPTLYNPNRRINDPQSEDGGFVAPPIPPITPARAGEAIGRNGRAPSIQFPGGGVSNVAPASPNQPSGLVLGGTNPPLTTPPPTGTLPLSPSSPGHGLVPPPALMPPAANGTAVVPPATGSPGRGNGASRESLTRHGLHSSGMFHAMPPGGVIGRTPGVGASGPGGAPPGVRHINPVGGLIGGGTPLRADGRVAAAGYQSGVAGAPIGRSGGGSTGRRDRTEQHWDPDSPWKISHGVDPVVRPTQEQRIDPGPAIGLR